MCSCTELYQSFSLGLICARYGAAALSVIFPHHKAILRLGGRIAENMEDCTHLIAQKVGKSCVSTVSFMCLHAPLPYLPVDVATTYAVPCLCMYVHMYVCTYVICMVHFADFKDSEISNWCLQLQVHSVQGLGCC